MVLHWKGGPKYNVNTAKERIGGTDSRTFLDLVLNLAKAKARGANSRELRDCAYGHKSLGNFSCEMKQLLRVAIARTHPFLDRCKSGSDDYIYYYYYQMEKGKFLWLAEVREQYSSKMITI